MRCFRLFFLALITTACGDTNFLSPFVAVKSDAALLTKASEEVDQEKYAAAQTTLTQVAHDSSEKRLLQVAATLGESGLSVWQIVLNILNDKGVSSASSGIDGILDSILGSVFGTGDVRLERIAALSKALALVRSAPEQSLKFANISCLLGGLLAVPRVSDALSTLDNAQATLVNVGTSISGTGASAAECPNLGEFSSALETIKSVRNDFVTILSSIKGCSFLDLASTESQLNVIEKQLSKLSKNADKGCATISCTEPYCAALKLGCVQTLLADTTAVAGDGIIATCELVQNCINPTTCFNR